MDEIPRQNLDPQIGLMCIGGVRQNFIQLAYALLAGKAVRNGVLLVVKPQSPENRYPHRFFEKQGLTNFNSKEVSPRGSAKKLDFHWLSNTGK